MGGGPGGEAGPIEPVGRAGGRSGAAGRVVLGLVAQRGEQRDGAVQFRRGDDLLIHAAAHQA
jgi:hypothetical protein